MPYISPERRDEIERKQTKAGTTGELNYILSMVCVDYLSRKPRIGYKELSEVSAALADARSEFIRRVMSPFEDRKIIENGDIYNRIIDKITTDVWDGR